MAIESLTEGLGLGIYTIPGTAKLIPKKAASDSLGWISTDGKIELCRGKYLVGDEETANGYVKGEGWGFTVTGTKIHFRKISTKIQYYNTATGLWVDIVTGLTASAEYTFSPYQSLAGTFVYATGYDGIYKIHTANPGSYTSLYNSAKNYKGKSMIVQSRMAMWDVKGALTTLYLSYTDAAQDSTVYTSVSAEVIADVASGTLAFKGGGATRTCFNVRITDTSSGELFTDNYDGTLTGSLGNTGTINYTTGAFTISGQSGGGTADYSWEDSNAKGVTDFTFSGTRTALQGDVVRQDEGGDAILNVLFHDGSYYSLKSHSAYKLTIASDGLSFTNYVFRKDLGLPYWRATVVTGKGIVFMDTSNVAKPQLTILQPNLTGDNLEPVKLAAQFDFSKYYWDACAMGTYGEFIVFSGRTLTSSVNNKLFLYNVRRNTIDVLPYGAKTISNSEGILYIGDVLSDNIYQVLSGFDDDDYTIENYWISSDYDYQMNRLKKVKRLRLSGLITREQSLEVYLSYDGAEFELVGTILGNGSYVDFNSNYAIGSSGIGDSMIGGEQDTIDGSRYLCELKISGTKFIARRLKLVAAGIGYVSVDEITDSDIRKFQKKIPSRYRTKQNVSLDGTQTDL